jgi:uncharacterized protein YccT (UPF0319 family)
MSRVQLNARVAQKIKSRVALDKATTSATADVIVEVALENWFSAFDKEQRAKFYRAHHRKPYVRA